MLSGRLYEHPTLALPIAGSGCSSLLGTPPAHERTHSPRSVDHGADLANQVATLLPTPRTSDTNGAGSHGDGGDDLRTTVARMLTTPTTRDYKGANQRGDDSCLHGALLPTPCANERERKPDEAVARMNRAKGPDLSSQMMAMWLGAPTPEPSTDGNAPLDAPLPLQWTTEDDSAPPSVSG